MNLEIERKFFVPHYPSRQLEMGELTLAGRKMIEQTYLALTESEEIRVRRLTNPETGKASFTHTFKRGHGLCREEAEYSISEEIYQQLLQGSGRVPLVKTRTRVTDAAGREYDIDEYHQFNLMTVEAEFSSEAEALAFVAPDWFGEEVGSGEEYRNKSLWASVQK